MGLTSLSLNCLSEPLVSPLQHLESGSLLRGLPGVAGPGE